MWRFHNSGLGSPLVLWCVLLPTVTCVTDAEGLVSCARRPDDGIVVALDYSDLHSAVPSQTHCNELCFRHSHNFSLFVEATGVCYCGDEGSCTDCSDPEPADDSLLCGRLYAGGASPVSLHLTITGLGVHSSYDTLLLNATTAIQAPNITWTYTAGPWRSVTSSASSSTFTPVLSSEVHVTLEVTTLEGGAAVVPMTVPVLDPIVLGPSQQSVYTDLDDVPLLGVEMWEGSDVSVRWSRHDPNGTVLYGKYCEEDWLAIDDKCVKKSSDSLALDAAAGSCLSQGGSLLTLHDDKQRRDVTRLLLTDTDLPHLIGAVTSESSYSWQSSGDITYFTADMVTDAFNGDCVAMDNSALLGVSCHQQLHYICQKDAESCPGGGQYADGTCYIVSSVARTWTAAEEDCRTRPGGHLATPSSQTLEDTLSSHIANHSSGRYWLGLHDRDVDSQYFWVDGRSLEGQSVEGGSTWKDCVVYEYYNQSSVFTAERCDETLHYVCQYASAEFIPQIPSFIAGTAVFSEDNTPLHSLESGSSLSNPSTHLYLFPDMVFEHDGVLRQWNIVIQPSVDPIELHLQVYKPTCLNNQHLIPTGGCKLLNGHPVCTDAADDCDALEDCGRFEHFCELVSRCISLTEPCTCSAFPKSPTCSLSSTGTWPMYSMEHEDVAFIPASKVPVVYRVKVPENRNPRVSEHSIIGLQFAETSTVPCETGSQSVWRQRAHVLKMSNWITDSDVIDMTQATETADILCNVRGIYTIPMVLHPPESLTSRLNTYAGNYTFFLHAENALMSKTRKLTTVIAKKVQGLSLLFPQIILPNQTTMAVGTIAVPKYQNQTFLLSLDQGTRPELSWNLTPEITMFNASCPTIFTSHCTNSQTEATYAIPQYNFNTDEYVMTVSFTAKNEISEERLTVDVLVEEEITSLAIKKVNPNKWFMVNQEYNLVARITTGTHVSLLWKLPGSYNSSSTTEKSLTVVYTAAGVYRIKLTASNNLGSITRTNQLKIFTESKPHDLQLNSAPLAAAGETYTVYVTVYLEKWSTVTLTFDFGDGNTQDVIHEARTDEPIHDISVRHTYRSVGTVNVSVVLVDNLNSSTRLSSFTTVSVLEPVLGVELIAPTQPLSSGVNVTFSATTLSGGGTLYYAWDFGHGDSFFSTSPSITYVFSTGESYNVTLTVSNIASGETVTKVVEIQEPVEGLTLTYTQPTLVGETVVIHPYTEKGTNVEYEVDFYHNGSVEIFQNAPLEHVYPTPGVYNVSVTARNFVSASRQTLKVTVVESNEIKIVDISGPTCVQNGQPAVLTASVVNTNLSTVRISWWLVGGVPIPPGFGSLTLTYTFGGAGNHSVTLRVEDSVSGLQDTAVTHVCVQEEVGTLTMTTNSPLILSAQGDGTAEFSVLSLGGTDLSYEWITSLTSTTQASTSNVFHLPVTSRGVYVAQVRVYNLVSSKESGAAVWVLENNNDVLITSNSSWGRDLLLNEPYTFQLISPLQSGNMVYSWIVDGTEVSDLSQFVTKFTEVGSVTVEVVLNEGAVQTSETFNVEAFLQGVELTASPSLLDTTMTCTLNANTGSEVGQIGYMWSPCMTCPNTITTMDQYVHQYQQSGQYVASVVAFNNVSRVSASKRVIVLSEETSVLIQLRPLYEAFFVPEDQDIEIEARKGVNAQITSVSWEIKQTETSEIEGTYNGSSCKHVFRESKRYSIYLIARSIYGEPLVKYRTVQVIQRLSSLNFQIDKVLVREGDEISFEASWTGGNGANVSLKWFTTDGNQGDFTLQGENTRLFKYTFPAEGDYKVKLQASNLLGLASITRALQVHSADGCVIEVISPIAPYVSQGVAVPLTVHCPLASDTALYNWTFHDDTLPGAEQGKSIEYTFTQLGDVRIQVTVTEDDVGVSNHVAFTTVKVQAPPRGLYVRASSEFFVVNEEYQFTANASAGSDMRYTWTFGSNVKPISDSNTESHVFTTAGIVRVKVVATNNVGHDTAVMWIAVLERISGLKVDKCCNNVYETNEEISLSAAVDNGTRVFYKWTVFLESPVTSWGQVFNHKFSEAGYYDVSVTASNAAGSETSNITLYVEEAIQGLILWADPGLTYIYAGYHARLYSTVLKGQPLNYEFHVNNQTIEENRNLTLVERTKNSIVLIFNSAGSYVITVTATNNVSSIVHSRTANIKDLLCEPPDVKIVGFKHRVVVKSRHINLEVVVDACNRYLVLHKWVVYNSSCSDENDDIITLPSEFNDNTPMLLLLPQTLDYGSYCVLFTSRYATTPASSSVEFQLQVLHSTLMPIISGGDEKIVGIDHETVIDGTMSYDPDLPRDSDQQLTYTLTCQYQGSQVLNDGCFEEQHTGYYVIIPRTLHLHKVYVITLRISKPRRASAQVTQRLIVRSEDAPIASIDCLTCREKNLFYISHSMTIKLLGSCQNCGIFTQYTWRVVRSDGKEITLDDTTTTTGNGKSNLVMRRNVLQDNYTYEFECNVTSVKFGQNHGHAKLILEPIIPPSGGQCVLISDDVVVALRNKLTVQCSDWVDNSQTDSPLQYHVVVYDETTDETSSNWYPVYVGTNAQADFFLSPFESEEGNVVLVVYVVDDLGAKTEAMHRDLRVVSPDPKNGTRLDLIIWEVNNRLPMLKLQSTPWLIQQYIITLLLQLNGESSRDVSATGTDRDREIREQLRSDIISVINETMSLSALQDIQQLAFILHLITSYVDEFPKNIVTYQTIIALIRHIIYLVSSQVSQGWEGAEFMPVYLLGTVGNMIEVINIDLSDESGDDFLTSDVRFLVDGSGGILEMAVQIIDDIQCLLLQTQVANEAPYMFTTQYLQVFGVRTTADNIVHTYTLGSNSVSFPRDLLSDLGEMEVFQTLSGFISNPFIWGYQDKFNISSEVMSITFTFVNGSKINVSNLPPEHTIKIGLKEESSDENIFRDLGPEQTEQSTSEVTTGNQIVLNNRTFAANFNIRPYESMSSLASPQSAIQAPLSVFVIVSAIVHGDQQHDVLLKLYVGRGYAPDSDVNDGELSLTADWVKIGSDPPVKNETLMIQLDQWEKPEDFQMTLVNEDDSKEVNVSILLAAADCQYYHWNTSQWSSYGCQPTLYSRGSTLCECNHLTMFGASFLQISVDLNFTNGQSLSAVVISSLCVVALMYLLLLILARYWDVLDHRRVTVVPFCGHDSLYKYELIVVTGRRIGAGTTANVGVRLYGEEHASEDFHLQKASGGAVFCRNSVDVFMVATDKHLGPLWKLHLWHDNSGASPKWYLSHVIVRDVSNGTKTFFVNNSWLALKTDTDMIDRDLMAAGQEELERLATRFSAESARCLSEHHLWLSVVDRPLCSRATRVQRLSVCAATLLLYMATIAIRNSALSVPFNKSGVTWLDLGLGLYVPLILLPVSVILMMLFSESRLKPRVSDIPRPSSSQTVEMDALVDLGSRDGSASTYRAQRELIMLQNIDRESSAESISAKAGRLHRSDPLRVVREESLDDLLASFPECNTADDDVSLSTMAGQNGARSKAGRPRQGPTYDGILGWPDKSPWTPLPSKSNAKNKTQTTKADGGTSMDKNSNITRKNTRLTGSTDTLDQILDDMDMWSLEDVEIEPPKTAEPDPSTTSKPNAEAAQKFQPRQDASLGDDKGEAATESTQVTENTQTTGSTQAAESTQAGESTQATESTQAVEPNDYPKSSVRKTSTVSSVSSGRRLSVSWSVSVPAYPAGEGRAKPRSLSTSSTSSRVPYCSSPSPCSPRHRRPPLPHWCVHLAYLLLVLLSLTAFILIIIYGLHVTMETSVRWLVSLVTAIVTSLFLVEPVKAVVVALVNSLLRNTLDVNVFQYFQPLLEISDALKVNRMRPLGDNALHRARDEGKKLARLHSLFRQTVGYLLYLWLLLAINYATYRPRDQYLHHDNTKNDFLLPTEYTDIKFYDVRNVSEFWEWLELVAPVAIHAGQLSALSTHGHLIGVARLVQVRSQPVDCPATDALQKMGAGYLTANGCYRNSGPIDKKTYSAGWLPEGENNVTWEYSSAGKLDSVEYVGQTENYDGGGYMRQLGLDSVETRANITFLKQNNWVDRGTRAVFLEMTLYNPNVKLFSSARAVFEFPSTGGILPSFQVYSMEFLSTGRGYLSAIAVLQIFMIPVGIFQLVVFVTSVWKNRVKYFWSFWNVTAMTVCLLNWAKMLLFIFVILEDAKKYDELVEARNSAHHVSLLYNNVLQRAWTVINAICLFLVFLMIARQLRFIRPLSVFGRTLHRSGPPLVGVWLMFLLLLIAFAALTWQWYGSSVDVVRSMGSALVGMMVLLRAHVPFLSDMSLLDQAFTTVLCLAWFTVTLIFIKGLIIAILAFSYKSVKKDMYYYSTLESQDYKMVEFFIRQFKKWIGITKSKPAFRRVQFEGLSSESSSLSASSGQHSSDGCELVDLMDEAASQEYVERLVDRAPDTWQNMLHKLDQVVEIDEAEQHLTQKLLDASQKLTKRSKPVKKPHRTSSMKVTNTTKKDKAPKTAVTRTRSLSERGRRQRDTSQLYDKKMHPS